MTDVPKKKRDGIVDQVCQDLLAVFETPVYKQNKQKDQQARGLLQAVCQKLDPQKLFLYSNSEKPSKDFIVQCQKTIARLQDYSTMVARRMDSKNDISLISEKKISYFYKQEEPSFDNRKRKSTVGSDSEEDDEIKPSPAKSARRDEKNANVLRDDILRLETKVDAEKTIYETAKNSLQITGTCIVRDILGNPRPPPPLPNYHSILKPFRLRG